MGDIVTCIVKVVRENVLPEGVTVEQVMNGQIPEESESEEGEEGDEPKEGEKVEKVEEVGESDKNIMTAEEFNSMLDETEVEPLLQFEPGIVYSKQ